MALELTRPYFQRGNAIDFGCADGVFLPSLSRYFKQVCAIDANPNFVRIAQKLADRLALKNVRLICNKDLGPAALKRQTGPGRYQVLFLLETIEHIGRREALFESKGDFIAELFTLLDPDGIMVVSAPKMTGLAFLLQRAALALFGQYRRPLPFSDLIRAGFFHDTAAQEKRWDGEHEGFNHRKLEAVLKQRFRILKKKDMLFQVVYVLGLKNGIIEDKS